jgi:hypothetical protein
MKILFSLLNRHNKSKNLDDLIDFYWYYLTWSLGWQCRIICWQISCKFEFDVRQCKLSGSIVILAT